MAVDVLGDMLTASLITSDDVEAEREVILDEIAMHDDDPDDVVHNLFAATAWAGTPLARPIAGTAESIKALTRAQINGYYSRRYRAGDDDRRGRQRRPRRRRTPGPQGVRPQRLPRRRRRRPCRPRRSQPPAPVPAGEVHASRPFEQVNVVLGMQGLTRSDPRRYALGVLNAALGGGSSSRLFQEVRERRGLAYSVYSFGLGYSDAGMVGVAAGSLPSKADELLRVVRAELAGWPSPASPRTRSSAARARCAAALVLSLEDSGSRMTRLGEAELFQRRLRPIDEVLETLDAVTPEDVHTLARELFSGPETLAQVVSCIRSPLLTVSRLIFFYSYLDASIY